MKDYAMNNAQIHIMEKMQINHAKFVWITVYNVLTVHIVMFVKQILPLAKNNV